MNTSVTKWAKLLKGAPGIAHVELFDIMKFICQEYLHSSPFRALVTKAWNRYYQGIAEEDRPQAFKDLKDGVYSSDVYVVGNYFVVIIHDNR